MTSLINKITGNHQASASVVDGKLILSFPGAINPVVWQMDLSKAKASALEVQENKGGYALVLRTPKGENLDIATFDERAKSVDGLMAASRALENAYGQIHPAGASNGNVQVSGGSRKKGKKVLPIVLGLLVLLLIFWVWGAVSLQVPGGYQSADIGALQNSPSAAESAGVAVSADDFLMGK